MRIHSQNHNGFTLLEIVVALSVAMLILGTGTLLIGSVNEEHQLRRLAGGIETAAKAASLDAVSNQQTQVLLLNENGIRDLKTDRRIEVPGLEILVDSKWQVPRDLPWRFLSSGICEPVALRVTAETGAMEMSFDPLTGEVAEERVTINR